MNRITVKAGQKKTLPILWTGEETEMDINVDLAGEGAETEILLLLLGKGTSSLNIKAEVRHLARQTKSQLLVKGALGERARVDFDGWVKILPGAAGSDAWLGAHLLLLSGQAAGRAVPNLEIGENDVKAGHAATVGRVDEEQMFYLMSRGVDREQAYRLVVSGFAQSMLRKFPEKMRKLAMRNLSI